jgi:hypothetical protein
MWWGPYSHAAARLREASSRHGAAVGKTRHPTIDIAPHLAKSEADFLIVCVALRRVATVGQENWLRLASGMAAVGRKRV